MTNGSRLPTLFSTTDEQYHATLRRSVNNAFSMTTLVQYEPMVDATTEKFLDQTEELFSSKNAICDFTQWLQFYAFDVIGDITYSKRHGFVDTGKDVDGIIAYLGKLFSYVAPVFLTSTIVLAVTADYSAGWPNTYLRQALTQKPYTTLTRQIRYHVVYLPCRHLC